MQALLAAQVPAEVHTSPAGHRALGPQAVAWHTPLRHTEPAEQPRFETQLELHPAAVHTVHWPLRQVCPIGHWLIEVQLPAQELPVQAWHRPLLHTWPAAHSLF